MIASFLIIFISMVIGSMIIWLWGTQSFVGPIIGAILATGVTLSVNNYFKSQDAKKEKSNFLAAIIAEITALHALIESRKDQYAKNNYEFIDFYITEDYFTVFTGNANKLGALPKKIAARVIRVYMETKGLFDTVRAYSCESRDIINIDSVLFRMRAAGLQQTPDYNGLYEDFCRRHKNATTISREIMENYIPAILKELVDVKAELTKLKN